MTQHGLSLAQRFWLYVRRTNDERCWLWHGAMKSRYGTIHRGDGHKGDIGAHVASWEIHNGPVPRGMYVLHKCDNPRCVRPKHLFLGTHRSNMRDMASKGRAARPSGERHPSSKLTRADVVDIRRRLEAGETHAAVAKAFNVSTSHIARIGSREQWKHV